VVLTTAHLHDDDLATTDICRLRAMCQRCHNTMDAAMRQRHAAETRQRRRGQIPLEAVAPCPS
jgi:hypothetical protein